MSFNNDNIEMFKGYHPDSRIWIYASDRMISDEESREIDQLIQQFTREWTAHDKALKATGKVFFNRFVLLCVDESRTHASGCSIDTSVHFIRDLEKDFKLNLFDRLSICYSENNSMQAMHFSRLKEYLEEGKFSATSTIYDTTLTRLGDFLESFMKPASESWIAKFLN